MPTHSRWHVRRIALFFFSFFFHGRPPYPKSMSGKGKLETASVVHVYSKSTSFTAYERVGMASHVQMAACLAQWAVPRMIRESARWSEWEELPFVPPPHPHHRKSNKIVQSFCCHGQELPSPPFLSSIAAVAMLLCLLSHFFTSWPSLFRRVLGRRILLSRCPFRRVASIWSAAHAAR